MTNGTETTTIWNNFPTPPTVTTSTSLTDPPALPQEHCDTAQTPCGGPNVRRTADTELKLATGGPLGSTQQNMWMISASALDVATGQPIPYDQISIGGFGNPDTSGNLVVMLPDNDPTDITPRVPGNNNYTFSAGAQGYKLLVTCVSPYPTNTHRLTIGVGEEVNISLSPPLSQPMDSRLTWKTTAGSLSKWSGNTTMLTAPSNATTASVTMYYYNDRGNYVTYITNFTVIEPTGVDHANFVEYYPYTSTTLAGAGVHLRPFIGPTSVSFYRVQIMEVGQNATNLSGYFTPNNAPSHIGNGADVWIDLDYDNHWKDTGGVTRDWVTSYGWPPPWYGSGWFGGSYTWVIPALWRVVGTTNQTSMAGWSQVHQLSSDGTMTVSKFGHSVSRTIQGNYSGQ